MDLRSHCSFNSLVQWQNKWGDGMKAFIQLTNNRLCFSLHGRTQNGFMIGACPMGKIEFLRGRLKFGGCDSSAPFPSMIVIFEADKEV